MRCAAKCAWCLFGFAVWRLLATLVEVGELLVVTRLDALGFALPPHAENNIADTAAAIAAARHPLLLGFTGGPA